VKELREKGMGEEELAAAHAKWLEDEDAAMLQRLVRDMKRGFAKGRRRVQVCTTGFSLYLGHVCAHVFGT
jgi:hypothetical protein